MRSREPNRAQVRLILYGEVLLREPTATPRTGIGACGGRLPGRIRRGAGGQSVGLLARPDGRGL